MPSVPPEFEGESFLNLPGLPRGIRNNNPGNIKINPNNPWKGKVPEQWNSDGVFEQFWSYKWGVRAMIKLLLNYMDNGFRTIRAIVNRYAPNSENPTSQYIQFVSGRLGKDPDEPLTPDFETLRQLVQAMAAFENGREAVSDRQFVDAWMLLD
ncbi:MAG: structural protein [Bacteroidetes bacterium]|nr:MAG: structural protein [Bacteroidota bacterium]